MAIIPLKSTHYKKRRLRVDVKFRLADTFANCHLYYQAENWDPLPTTIHQSLATARNKALRSATRTHYFMNPQQAVSDEHLYVRAERADYNTQLRPRRLKYMCRLLTTGPRILLRVLDHLYHMMRDPHAQDPTPQMAHPPYYQTRRLSTLMDTIPLV